MDFYIVPKSNASMLKEKAQKNRHSGNLSEVLLWKKLQKKQLCGLFFSRQKVIDPYIVDFCCASKKTIIEIDGFSHEIKGTYDEKREDFLKSKGYKVIHISDTEIKKNLDEVCLNLELFFQSTI